MPVPADVEQRFQDVLFAFSYPCSPLQRLIGVNTFLAYLGDETSRYESYVLDCAQLAADQIRLLRRYGYAPEQIRQLVERYLALRESIEALRSNVQLEAAFSELGVTVAGLYAFAGDIESVVVILDRLHGQDPSSWWSTKDERDLSEPLEYLRAAATKAKIGSKSSAPELGEILTQWQRLLRNRQESVFVPVVEHSITGLDEDGKSGALLRLGVQILGAASGDADEIHSDVASYRDVHGHERSWKVPLRAARALLRQSTSGLGSQFVVAYVTTDIKNSLHAGESSNLAAAVLFYVALLRYGLSRTEYTLLSTAAISGDIDATGTVLLTDPSALRQKMTSVFFSYVRTVVVPKEQEAEAQRFVDELTARYPRRQLSIVGLKHLREVFWDLRLIERNRISLPVHLGRCFWRKRIHVVALAALLALALVATRLIYGPIDRYPALVEFSGEMMSILNKSGDVLADYPVGRATVLANSDSGAFAAHKSRVALADAQGDGLFEVYYVQLGSGEKVHENRLNAWSFATRNLLWSRIYESPISFPEKPDAAGSDYTYSKLVYAGQGLEEKGHLLLSANHLTSFPSFLRLINPMNGDVDAEYLHIGHIHDFVVADINADGIREVLLCGVNNAFRMVFVSVIDERMISGHSPSAGVYMCTSHQPAAESFYLLIPQTDIGRLGAPTSKGNSARFIEWNETDKSVLVNVDDAGGETTRIYGLSSASLTYVFDSSLRPLRVGQGNDYDILAERLLASGLLRQKPDASYFERQLNHIRYWDGKAWRTKPVKNKNYEMVLGRDSQ